MKISLPVSIIVGCAAIGVSHSFIIAPSRTTTSRGGSSVIPLRDIPRPNLEKTSQPYREALATVEQIKNLQEHG